MNKKTASQIFVLFGLIVFATFALPNATRINDWLHSLSYTPSKTIQMIAEDAGMSDEGKRLFYRYEPRLLSEKDVEDRCGFGEIVLGCFTDDGIFIIDYNNDSEYNRTLVTASHEMLHVAYFRQSQEQSQSLWPVLDKVVVSAEQDIQKEVNSYDDQDQRYDEAFAIVGSQLQSIPQELEQAYDKYFFDRSKTTNAFTNSPEAN